ncbi:hypothetical protein Tco_0852881 [Tanacetum coccineum]
MDFITKLPRTPSGYDLIWVIARGARVAYFGLRPSFRIKVLEKLHFIEEPIEIMDREVKQLKQSRIPIVKVRWKSSRGPEYTWEREDQIWKKYPHLFDFNKKRATRGIDLQGRRSPFRGKCCDNPSISGRYFIL